MAPFVICFSGLGHSAVQRLKNTWDKLPTKHSKAFEVSCACIKVFFMYLSMFSLLWCFLRASHVGVKSGSFVVLLGKTLLSHSDFLPLEDKLGRNKGEEGEGVNLR